MIIRKSAAETRSHQDTVIYLLKELSGLTQTPLTPEEQEYIRTRFKPETRDVFVFNRLSHFVYVQLCPVNKDYRALEYLRKAGDKAVQFFRKEKQHAAVLIPSEVSPEKVLAYAEGVALGAYEFLKHKKSGDDKVIFSELNIDDAAISEMELANLQNLVKSCYLTRDMVNEPVNVMDTLSFSRLMADCCREAGAKVTVMNQKEIEAHGMEGLLTVNKGSKSEPAFTVIEWKPDDASNDRPLVLVGKGLVFDTGGINLKPGSGLDAMKSDMAGGAAVFGTLYALALNQIPVHVVGLIPVTDNRPGENAMVPGDIIRMGNGKTVEIINTDAEGRLILADALLFAQKFNPLLVIDIATLTGAASVALGRFGMAGVHQDAAAAMAAIIQSGQEVYERIVEFPFWEEYDNEIHSDVADLRNIGKNRGGGVITAGKFLAAFTAYPWIHLDIAPVAFMDGRESYRGKGATAAGVRLLHHFVESKKWLGVESADK